MARRHLFEFLAIAAVPVILIGGFMLAALVYVVTALVRLMKC